jgi:hypothetical protein
MELLELRILAVGGIVAIGTALGVLAVVAATVAGWIDRVWRARADAVGTQVVGQGTDLGAGRARC